MLFSLLYFASLIMFMKELYLDNYFWTLFLFFSFAVVAVVVVVVSGFVIIIILFFHYICSYSFLVYMAFLLFGICIPFYVIFDIFNVSITFFIALPGILFSYLLRVLLLKFPYSIFVMTILL